MKKILTSLLIVLSLSSCSFGNGGNVEIENIKISGILKEKALNQNGPGTHVLLSDSGIEHFVSSILINLSNEDYLDNNVELSGTLNEETKLFSVSSISVLSVVEDDVLENVSFKKYENFDLGISLFYYDDWEILEETNLVSFYSPVFEDGLGDVYDLIEIEQFQFNYEASVFDSEQIDSPLKNYAATNHPEITNFDKFFKQIGKNRIDAIEVPNERSGADVYIYRNGLIYFISFIPHNALDVSPINRGIFYEMLDSIELLDSMMDDFMGDIEDLGTLETSSAVENLGLEDSQNLIIDYLEPSDEDFAGFESSSYKFKAVYPKKWYYQGSSDSEPKALYSFLFSENDEFENVNYSLSVYNSKPNLIFQEQAINGSNLFFYEDESSLLILKEVSGRFYGAKGKNQFRDYMIKSVLSVESL